MVKKTELKHNQTLSQLPATAICGNDISSSCLYVVAIAIGYAGQYAWISLLIVSAVLYLYRSIYAEVVGAVPMNGGIYNALLNTTSKSLASYAASLSLLSYMATAVIAAIEAMKYASVFIPALSINFAAIIILSIFTLLTLLGIRDSARLATVIFIFHLITLSILVMSCAWYLIQHDGGTSLNILSLKGDTKSGPMYAIFIGFAVGMLGISGFESSANYIEQQSKGVFPKTLRNMWLIITIINPLLAILILSFIPLEDISTHQGTLLSYAAEQSMGTKLSLLISVDAVLVLCGSVLTAFVGVNGLLVRITSDSVLPAFLMKKNRWGAYPRCTLLFYLLCISIIIHTQGELEQLAAVYAFGFLFMMLLFACSNLLLKARRPKLERNVKAPVFQVIIAIIAVVVALIGNFSAKPTGAGMFMAYFIPTIIVFIIVRYRVFFLRLAMSFLKQAFNQLYQLFSWGHQKLEHVLLTISNTEYAFVCEGSNIALINRALLYIMLNEDTKKVIIISIYNKNILLADDHKQQMQFLILEYPLMEISHIEKESHFGPAIIRTISKELTIPINRIFISSIQQRKQLSLEKLGDVRVII
ncbi:APC family permease [Shewanella surugensis]|uniref:APC family permease n=1 Tax=Shewanella surugensis TaxID=212020 RepID=A0ABT0LDS9_9GAMM|nr:APC family permease [Shewanella surugensis]MCL1125852.1 APC family permease [Shewanella surugensis]